MKITLTLSEIKEKIAEMHNVSSEDIVIVKDKKQKTKEYKIGFNLPPERGETTFFNN